MATLPSDIISEILSRMPVKSLVRFRCVSKLWCEYIDNPYFATIHSKRAVEEEPTLVMLQATRDWCNPNQPRIVSFHNTFVPKHDNAACLLEVKKNSFLEFKCCKQSSEYPLHVVLGSCNGLFYLSQDQCDKFNSLVVINPLRKECFELPPMDKKPDWRLSYEESCGLGFDYSTNTFKMVCVFPRVIIDVEKENITRKNLCTMVHVLGTNLWREPSMEEK
ncbi:putative F-box domain-containing protein [Tanacetum coccineum]